jgi:hypothetical protein
MNKGAKGSDMLRFIKKKQHYSGVRLKHYFPIFAVIILSLLFSICVLHYSQQPFFFVTESLSVAGSD